MKKCAFISVFAMCLVFSAFSQSLSKSFDYNGQTRNYRLYVPSIYDGTEDVPLLLALHGLGDNGANFQGVGFNQIANTENFIAVYPTALPDPVLGGNGWNVGLNPLNSTDDVGFLRALLDTITTNYQIDSSRIYVTGFSMGGFMCHRLACEMGDKIAAIASVSGTLPATGIGNCNSGYPIPVLHMHGTSDQTVPYGPQPIFGIIGNLGADSTARFWAHHNNCNLAPDSMQIPDTKNDGLTIEKFTYGQCDDSSEVILYKIYGADHTWLGPTNDIFATDVIWDFFSRHQKKEHIDTVATGLENISGSFALSPNPFTTGLYIKNSGLSIERIAVYDLAGKQVYSSSGLATANEVMLPLAHLNNGAYILRLISSDQSYSRKIIKQAQ